MNPVETQKTIIINQTTEQLSNSQSLINNRQLSEF